MSFEKRLVAIIEATGPMSVADWMNACLYDPEDGYYTTREPFGTGGDFTTAPEISQIFGELVAAWLAHGWREMGAPGDAILVEIGPGRGTLMLDMARTVQRLAPSLVARLHLVETSPRLRDVQRERLSEAGLEANWHESIETLPEAPALMVANELFDAIPARQFTALGGRWVERCVGLVDGRPAFVHGAGTLPEKAVVPDGTIIEIAPAREAIMTGVAGHLARYDGLMLTIDYGSEGGPQGLPGSTLQALKDQRPADPLEAPGRADLTTHVDFAALASAAREAGAHTLGPMPQGEFLLALGLLERAGALGAGAGEAERDAIRAAVERLAGPDAMGTLFKVLAVSGRERRLLPFGT